MKVIGLTGNIGSGKSTVAQFFRELGAAVIDADSVAREVVEPGRPALVELTEAFGENILNADGRLNRGLVADIVFNDDKKREILNGIIHPAIYNEITGDIQKYRNEGAGIVIIEAALIIEKKGLLKLIDKLIVVSVNEETQVERLLGRGDLSREQISARIKSQSSNEEKVRHADYVIDNNSGLEKTREQVQQILGELI